MKMNIEKSKLSKALKQISIFVNKNGVNKNASLIHFKNENNRAMIFATDFTSAGRSYFDTEEAGAFEFCIDYSQISQVLKIRNKVITSEIFETEQGNGIMFYDEKTKFTWSLRNPDELIEIENNTKIPEDNFFCINAKVFKNALREAGYARNEKETQNVYLTGVDFVADGASVFMASTDRHRIAAWNMKQEGADADDSKKIEGILSPKIVQSVNLFDDEEEIKIYIEDSKIVLVSSNLEAYATKIQAEFPDMNKFFEKEVLSSYEILSADILESLSIIEGINTKTLKLNFSENQIKISATNDNGDEVNDYFSCVRLNGEDEEIYLDPELFMDIFKNVKNEKINLEFRNTGNNFKILSYTGSDGAYGMLAPQRR